MMNKDSGMMGYRDSIGGTLIRLRCRHVERTVFIGPVRGPPPRQRGAAFLEAMVARASLCGRRAAHGHRSQIVRYGRFLANQKVTLEALLAGWGEQTGLAAAGRHVLAIQDTSEINFTTAPERRRGLGEAHNHEARPAILHGPRPTPGRPSKMGESTSLARGEKTLKTSPSAPSAYAPTLFRFPPRSPQTTV